MIELKFNKFKSFLMSDIFKIDNCKQFFKSDLFFEKSKTPYITSSAFNNGFFDTVNSYDKTLNLGGCISVGGVGLKSFYQHNDFIAGDKILTIRNCFINQYNAIFIIPLIDKSLFEKCSYGRVASKKRLSEMKIMLPYKECGNPDWQFMEDYIKQFEETNLLEIQKTDYKEDVKLPDVGEWRSFFYSDLFDLKRGSMTKKPEKSGLIPYVSSSGMNNALTGMYDVIDKHIIDKSLLPLITVANNGSVGSSFIQEIPFAASSDVSLLLPKFTASKEVLVFIKIIIEESKDLYSYGRKWGLDKMRNSELKLPVLDDGSPDFNLIERYIKSLPYSEMI